MLELSVIICAHNPHRSNLNRTLEGLRQQTLPVDRWELVVVDNGSTMAIANDFELSWHPHGRHVHEPRLGLSSARQRGIIETSASLLVFVDDDNVLAQDYLTEILRIDGQFPFLGAWGSGAITLEFEKQPASHVRHLMPWLGLRCVDRPLWTNVPSCTDAIPIGAGLCLRREVAIAYVDFCRSTSIEISGRKGTSLGAHEDYEICYLACKAGLGMGVFPELKIQHLIVASRVSETHLLKLVESVSLSNLVLAYKWYGTIPQPVFSPRGLASMAWNFATRRKFDRRLYLAELRADLAARRMLATRSVATVSAVLNGKPS